MAVPAYRSSAAVASPGAGDTVDFPVPVGTAEDDIVICLLYGADNAQAITPPSGFTQVEKLDQGSFTSSVWWKRATASESTYTFTVTGSSWNNGVSASFSGCDTAASPIGASSQNGGTGVTITATGITTVEDDSLLLFLDQDSAGDTGETVPTGMTMIYDEVGGYGATLDVATAGATGDKTQGINNDTDWSGFLVALNPIASGAPIITDVNTTESWTDGDTGLVITGTGFV